MKKAYTAPELMFEVYEMSASIASQCQTQVSAGPADPTHEACDEFKDVFDTFSMKSSRPHNVQFYDTQESVCDCEYTAGNTMYWTS